MTATTEVDPRVLDQLYEAEVEVASVQEVVNETTRTAERDGLPFDEVVDLGELERRQADRDRAVCEVVTAWDLAGRPEAIRERVEALPRFDRWLAEANRDPKTEAAFDQIVDGAPMDTDGRLPTEPPPPRHSDALIDWGSFWATDHTATDFIVPPFLAKGRTHSITATAKEKKSLLSLYVSACAATGSDPFTGAAMDPVRVLYLDQEMTAADLQERLLDMGFDDGTDLSNLAYYQLAAIAPLDTPAGANELHELVDRHGAELVMIDTLARVIEGDENDSLTYHELYRYSLAPLKARGVTTVRLDHAGHEGKRARGSSAKSSDVDVGWFIEPTDGGMRLKAIHRRVGWIPETVDLAQHADPLRWTTVADSWPNGTRTAAKHLDELGVPLKVSKRVAAKALREAGFSAANDAVCAAIRLRSSHGPLTDHSKTNGADQ